MYVYSIWLDNRPTQATLSELSRLGLDLVFKTGTVCLWLSLKLATKYFSSRSMNFTASHKTRAIPRKKQETVTTISKCLLLFNYSFRKKCKEIKQAC